MDKIKEIYKSTRLDLFCMAASHLLDIGWRTAQQITDEDLEEIEGNGLMTADYVRALCRTARDISKACTPVKFIQFCQLEQLYDISEYEGVDDDEYFR